MLAFFLMRAFERVAAILNNSQNMGYLNRSNFLNFGGNVKMAKQIHMDRNSFCIFKKYLFKIFRKCEILWCFSNFQNSARDFGDRNSCPVKSEIGLRVNSVRIFNDKLSLLKMPSLNFCYPLHCKCT